jgi:hypothetical protein
MDNNKVDAGVLVEKCQNSNLLKPYNCISAARHLKPLGSCEITSGNLPLNNRACRNPHILHNRIGTL